MHQSTALQVLKHTFFKGWDRPTVVLANVPNAHFVPEHPEKHNSFPSGHATSFAAGGLAFAWFFRRFAFIFQAFIALFTIGLTYTRVHLGVHFLGDIFAGTLIGTLAGLVLFKFSYPPLHRWIEKKESGLWEPWENYILIGATLLAILRFAQMAFF